MPHVIYAPAGEKDLPRLREIFLRCFGEEAAPEMEYVFSRCGDASRGKPPHCCGRIAKRTGNSTGKMALPIAAPWGWGNLPRGAESP